MQKTALIILDGFAITNETKGNAILKSGIPYLKKIIESYPKTLLKASSQEVGLPWGEVGNSEVGHTTIGLGRVVLQDLPQIDNAFRSGMMSKKNTIINCIQLAMSGNKVVHIIGMISDGAVHGHINHMIELAKLIDDKGLKPILHLISDGRDVDEKSAINFIEELRKEVPEATISSISGRYYAMDRDKNYDRTEMAYKAMHGSNHVDVDVAQYIENQYKENLSDEYIVPASFGENPIKSNEPVIFTNFRSDRAIQLTRSFVDKIFNDFDRGERAEFFATMTTYDDNLPARAIFSNLDLNNPNSNPLTNSLPEILSQNNINQFHVAETEKFAHVTYFLSGGIKKEFEGQKNYLIPSKKVKSYAEFPQMRAMEITSSVINASEQQYKFIVANYANGDMVGHSGDFDKTVESIQFLDKCLNESITKLLEKEYCIFLTADHGNADEMVDLKSGKPSKEHSLNPVPFIQIEKNITGRYVDFDKFLNTDPIGILSDIAPTILSSMGINTSVEMSGTDLRKSLI